MRELAAQAWNPWVAWLVLGMGAMLLLVTLGAPLRALPRTLSALRGRSVTESGSGPLWLALAAATGMGGITGGVLAVGTGGPGALVWMWIATALGMAIAFAEGSLGARSPDDDEPASVHLLKAPRIGPLLAPMYAIAMIVMALVVGAAFQSNQAAAVLDSTLGLPPRAAAIGLALVATPFVLVPRLRRPLFVLVPMALVLYVAAALALLFNGDLPLGLIVGDAVNQAFGLAPVVGGAAGGGVGLLVAHGVLRATMAGEAGLGSAALLDLRTRSRSSAGAVAMLIPLLASGVVGTLSGLLMLVDSTQDRHVADPKLVPIERAYNRGLRPSQQVGQTIVLPEDAPMEVAKFYAVKLRANPRGHALAKLVVPKDQDETSDALPHVALPHWAIAQATDTVVFHARDSERAKSPSWDVRVPCIREVKTVPGSDRLEYLVLRPRDPTLDMRKLAVSLDLLTQPHVVFDDLSFVGQVGRATSPDGELGEHLAMYEAPTADRAFNPKLHEFFRMGFRGPYADDEGPRPPWAFVAREGFSPEIGTIVDLRLPSDPRGDAVVALTRSGTVEAPPWDLLLDARTLVIRHEDEPAKDLRLPVIPHYGDHRIRFEIDMWGIAPIPGYIGPYLMVPRSEYEAAVGGDPHAADSDGMRAVLLTREALDEQLGPFSKSMAPPDFVLNATKLVLRHDSDKAQDIIVPVHPLHEGQRVRLDANLHVVEKTDHYAGPHLVVPPYDFQAEVHGDTRLPEDMKGRRVLVPLHPLGEMQGPFGEGDTYRPHPGELVQMGMSGPVLVHEGAQIIAARLSYDLGGFGRFAIILAVIVFALSTIVGWAELGGRAATAVLGSLGGPALHLAMLAAAALGTSWTLAELIPVVDLSLAAVAVPSLLGLLLLLPRVLATVRGRDDTGSDES